jgi:hypothetical protein
MTIMIRPSFGTGRTPKAADLPAKKSGKFFAGGLDGRAKSASLQSADKAVAPVGRPW